MHGRSDSERGPHPKVKISDDFFLAIAPQITVFRLDGKEGLDWGDDIMGSAESVFAFEHSCCGENDRTPRPMDMKTTSTRLLSKHGETRYFGGYDFALHMHLTQQSSLAMLL
jgi:hypothetical protein